MARRTGQPAHIRAELETRSAAGAALDHEYPTVVADGSVVPARIAAQSSPSETMVRLAASVVEHLRDLGARHVTVDRDPRHTGQPGNLTVRWFEGVPAAEVAAAFAVSHTDDGVPCVPSWLCLRADDDFDLRWQPPY